MATFDATKNFAKVTVSTGYDAAATSIVLASGHGAKLPLPSTDGEFNLVWWNNTDYGDPTDDPNREIVRCTARSTDTLTIARAQEGEAAAIKNIAGKTYRMALTITKKVIDDIVDNLGASSTITVNQATHGFVVGDVVRSSGTDNQYTKAQANSEANAEVVGMVTLVEDASNFIITTSGLIDAAAAVPSATAGDVLFLSPTVAGGVTATAPTTAGQVSKPLGIVTADDTEMIFINFRGALIADSDFPSQTYITVKMGTEADGDDNLTFSLTTGSFTAGKYLSVYKNGMLQEEGASADYTTSGTTIAVFNTAVLDTDKITLVVRSYEVTGLDDPLTTAGDIIYRNATVPARLGIGTSGQVLSVNSGETAPEWVSKPRSFGLTLFGSDESVSIGDGVIYVPITADMNGLTISDAIAVVHTKGITGTTNIQIRRRRNGTDVNVLSTAITIGDEFYASDGVIDSSYDDLQTGDAIYFDVDGVHSGTAPLGLGIMVTAE